MATRVCLIEREIEVKVIKIRKVSSVASKFLALMAESKKIVQPLHERENAPVDRAVFFVTSLRQAGLCIVDLNMLICGAT